MMAITFNLDFSLLGVSAVPLASFAGSLGALAIVYGLSTARRRGTSASRAAARRRHRPGAALGGHRVRAIPRRLHADLPQRPLADGIARRRLLLADPRGAGADGGGVGRLRDAPAAGARPHQRRQRVGGRARVNIERTERIALCQRLAGDRRGGFPGRAGVVCGHHRAAPGPAHCRRRSPPGAAGIGALRRGVSIGCDLIARNDHRAARAPGRHRDRHPRRPGVPMAPVPTQMRRIAAAVAVAVWFGSGTSGTASAALPPKISPAASSRSCRRPPRCSSRWGPATGSRASATTIDFRPRRRGCPRSAGLIDPDVERVLALKPDLVIAHDTQADLKRQLERARVPMLPHRAPRPG